MLTRDLIIFKRHSVLIRDLITWANKRPMQLHVNRIGDFLTIRGVLCLLRNLLTCKRF